MKFGEMEINQRFLGLVLDFIQRISDLVQCLEGSVTDGVQLQFFGPALPVEHGFLGNAIRPEALEGFHAGGQALHQRVQLRRRLLAELVSLLGNFVGPGRRTSRPEACVSLVACAA